MLAYTSPVSPVFHTEATVYLGLQGRVDVEFQNKVLTLIQIITENRNRRASGPVQPVPLIPLHVLLSVFCLGSSAILLYFGMRLTISVEDIFL